MDQKAFLIDQINPYNQGPDQTDSTTPSQLITPTILFVRPSVFKVMTSLPTTMPSMFCFLTPLNISI